MRTRSGIIAVLGLWLALSVLALARPDGDEPGLASAPRSDRCTGAARAQRAGLNAHLLREGVGPRRLERRLRLIRSSGACIVRVDVEWPLLEPSRGSVARAYQARVDRLVRRAHAHRVDLLVAFVGAPCWASPAVRRQGGCAGQWWTRDEVVWSAPTEPGAYGRALARLVRRYGAQVAAWEIWNEPNREEFFRSPDRPAAYARLVRAAYARVKAADPRAFVVAGSLNRADVGFTRALYRHGIAGRFDAFSVHPYTDDRAPTDTAADPQASFVTGVPAIHRAMRAHGDDRPIWLTEFGWTTSAVRGDTAAPWRNGVDEATQARYVQAAFAVVRRWRYVRAALLYELLDEGEHPGDPRWQLGLVRADGTPKPAFAAFRAAAARLHGGPREHR